MRLITLITAALLLAGSLVSGGRVDAQEQAPVATPEGPRFWQAAGGVVAINGFTWAYNWYVQRWHWANVGTQAWWKNMRDGFAWDDDAFMDNQLAHPYHGSLYFNAARGSHHSFWGSTAYVAAGSLTWELLSENVRPSLNDLLNTTLGGIALGEVTFRLSELLASGSRSGRSGVSREAGAFILSPMSRTQRWLRGKPRGPQAASQPRPASSGAWISLGRRTETAASHLATTQGQPFVGLGVQYGSPFAEGPLRPYDAFDFGLQFSPEETGVISSATISGLLTRRMLRTDQNQVLLGLYQHFDYDQTAAFKAGSQSLSGALQFRRRMDPHTHLSLGLHVEAVPIGAVSSDHRGIRNRDYDYGAGMGGRLTGSIQRRGRHLLRLDGRMLWIHSLYGAAAEHVVTTARLGAIVPVVGTVGLGGEAGLTFRRSVYRDEPRVLKRVPELRAYLVWSAP